MTKRNTLLILGISLSLLFTKPTFAIDLNGTMWVGTFQCRGVDGAGNKISVKIEDVTLSISQTGTDAVVTANFGGGGIPYDGTVRDDAKKPATQGFLGIVHPSTSPESSAFNELVWGKVVCNAQTGKCSFNGTGERVSNPANGFDTCKWRFKTVGP